MGTHCGRIVKSKPKSASSPKNSSQVSSHMEKTTDPHENHESSPHSQHSFDKSIDLGFGSREDVRKVYEIDPEMIGKGHFSTVRKAVLAGDNGAKALNFSLKSVLWSNLDPHLKDLLGQEIEILKSYRHPRIVRFYEAYQDPKFEHTLLEYMSGGDLHTFLTQQPDGVMEEKAAKKLMFELFSTVKFLHQNRIVHRDLKPENLLFDAERKVLKLIDFGLSKYEKITNMKTIVGSPIYIAPEILAKRGYDNKCDLWSLGVILYQCLQGQPPFFEESVHDLFVAIENNELKFKRERISKEAKDLISKMLRKSPKDRISIEEALKHPFFSEIVAELKNNTFQCDLPELKKVLEQMKKNSALFKDKFASLRHLLLEFGLQFLSTEEKETLERYYRFFDPKLKGEISMKGFMKKLALLGISWPENDVYELFRDYNEAFMTHNNSQRSFKYHNFLLALIGNIDCWLEKAWKSSIGLSFEKAWIRKCFERKLMKVKEEDLMGSEMKDLVKKLIGKEEELEEENGVERKAMDISFLKYTM